MKLDNLEVGQVVKNYKELCGLLDIEPKTGNAKKYQLIDIERHLKYEKQGHKFVIVELLLAPEEKKGKGGSNNTLPFIDEMELLVIDLLFDSDEVLIISNSKLLKELWIVNKHYHSFMDKKEELAKKLNMTVDFVYDYYDVTNSTFKSAIDTVMKRLSNKKLIIHEKIMMVEKVRTGVRVISSGVPAASDLFDYDAETNKVSRKIIKLETDFRPANDNERHSILKIENDILLNDFNTNNIQDVFLKGKINEYYIKLNDRLWKELNIKRAYIANRITINHQALHKEVDRQINKLMYLDTVMQCSLKLMKRLNENSIKRHHDSFFKKDSVKNIMRRNENYIKNNFTLTDNLIDGRTIEIIEVPKVKKEVSPEIMELFNDSDIDGLM